MIREFEFYNKQGGYGASLRPYKFEALITTYELVLKDANTLSRVNWNYLIVDEAHRLKNNDSALYQVQRLLLLSSCAGPSRGRLPIRTAFTNELTTAVWGLCLQC